MSTKKEREAFNEQASAWAAEHGMEYENLSDVWGVLYVPEDPRAPLRVQPTIRAYHDLRDTDFERGWDIRLVTETRIVGFASPADLQAMSDLMFR